MPKSSKAKSVRKVHRKKKDTKTAIVRGIPQRMFTEFVYTSMFELVSGASGAPAPYTWYINSLFDPNASFTTSGTSGVVNHQPGRYDTFVGTSGQLFNRYIVHACSWDIEILNEGTDPVRCMITTAPHTEVATSSDTYEAIQQLPQSYSYMFSQRSSGANRQIRHRGSAKIKDIEGVKSLDRVNHSALSSASPTWPAKLVMYVQALETGVTSDKLYVQLKLKFKAELFDQNIQREVD